MPPSGLRLWRRLVQRLSLVLLLGTASVAWTAPPQVLPGGERPQDARLGELRHVNSYFPMTVPKTKAEWDARAEFLRRQLAVSQGIWPQPTKTPLNVVIHGAVEREGYTVERVYFESIPGHFVSGSLYRPAKKSGPLPAVLCPHGHWNEGRFYKDGDASLKKQLVTGGERFEIGGRYPLQARCVTLARMGCVVFHYDMVGYADSQQIVHRPGPREALNHDERGGDSDWGFFSPQAESRLQTLMGLQTWNSIRALDFVTSLADVDPKRIAVTGASGGGTQTFILCALDPRPAVAFPAVMVSTAMQGGCTCENAALLRVETGNIELAALIAPRPLGMTAADDWTKELETKGLPELKELYKLVGAPNNVMGKALTQFGHNYNYVSREVMYQWMNKHLKLGLPDPVIEEDFKPLTVAEMTVWDEQHPAPPKGPEVERAWLRWLTRDAVEKLTAIAPRDAESLQKYQEVVGGAWEAIIGTTPKSEAGDGFVEHHANAKSGYQETVGHIRCQARRIDLPAVLLRPDKHATEFTVWLDGAGKAGLYGSDGNIRPEIKNLLDAGHIVVGVDLLYQGEFLADGKPLTEQRLVDKKNSYNSAAACYTFGYNRALFCQRVQDALAALQRVDFSGKRNLVGVNGAGPIALAAAAQAGKLVDRVAVDTQGFRFVHCKSIADVNFVPGAVKYDDVPGLMALCAPRPLWVAGEGDLPKLVVGAYAAAGKSEALVTNKANSAAAPAEIVFWLLK